MSAPEGSPLVVEQDPKTRIGLQVFEDHRGVVGTAGPVADRQQSLAELLDREILPCLERPGRLLGPFDLPSATVTGETRVALVWPSVAEGAHAPVALRPLLVGLPNPRTFHLSLGSVPSPNLRAALRHHGLPVFDRPAWEPLADAHLWLVWLAQPLQLTGLVSLLQDSGLPLHALDRKAGPRIVVAGPAAARLQEILRVYADAVLPGLTDPDARAWEALASAATAPGDWSRALARCGQVLGPVSAPSQGVPDPVDLPGPVSHSFEIRDELSVGMDFLQHPDWDEAGRVNAYTRHVVVGSGSEQLRAALGLRDTAELVSAMGAPLGEETASLCLHFVLGLPGETAADRTSIVHFLDTVVGAAPRGVRQVAARLHELQLAAAPATHELSESRSRWLTQISDAVTCRRLTVAAPPCGAALVEGLLAEGPRRAGLLEWMVTRAADQPEILHSLLAWRMALEAFDGPADDGVERTGATVPSLTGLPRKWQVEAPARISPAAPRSRASRNRRKRPDRWTRWRALTPQRFDYRIEYAKEGRLRFLGPTELSDLLLGACERAQIPVCTTGIVQPRLRVGYGPSLPAGIAGDREYIDLSLERKIEDLGQRLRTELPDQLRLHAVEFMPRCGPLMQLSRVALAEYEAEIEAGHHSSPAAREEDIARVKQWNRRIEEGMPAVASDDSDPIHQLCAIQWNPVNDHRFRLEFTLDLRLSGARCKPRDVVARVLTGLAVDPRLVPLRRHRLLVVDESTARARLRTPLEQVQLARRQLRSAERTWAE